MACSSYSIEEHFIYNASKKWSHNIQLQLFFSMRTPKKNFSEVLNKIAPHLLSYKGRWFNLSQVEWPLCIFLTSPLKDEIVPITPKKHPSAMRVALRITVGFDTWDRQTFK